MNSESHFGPLLTKKVICECRRQEEELKIQRKTDSFPYTHCKMACPEGGGDKLHHKQQLKM